MSIKPSIPYAVVSEGSLSFFKESVPLWVIMLLTRIHHFNSRRGEKYTLYLEKESIKLRVSPEILIAMIDELRANGSIAAERVNTGLYLVNITDTLLKSLDILT